MDPTSPQPLLCENGLLTLCIKRKPPESQLRSGEQLPLPECILPKWCICKYFQDIFITILLKRIHCDVKTVRNLVIKRWNSFKCNPSSLSKYGDVLTKLASLLESLPYFSNVRTWQCLRAVLFTALYPMVSLVAQTVKSPSAMQETDPVSIPGSGRSPRGGNGHTLQYSFLEIPMNRGAWYRGLQYMGSHKVGYD